MLTNRAEIIKNLITNGTFKKIKDAVDRLDEKSIKVSKDGVIVDFYQVSKIEENGKHHYKVWSKVRTERGGWVCGHFTDHCYTDNSGAYHSSYNGRTNEDLFGRINALAGEKVNTDLKVTEMPEAFSFQEDYIKVRKHPQGSQSQPSFRCRW